jgi:hypothetical protein
MVKEDGHATTVIVIYISKEANGGAYVAMNTTPIQKPV